MSGRTEVERKSQDGKWARFGSCMFFYPEPEAQHPTSMRAARRSLERPWHSSDASEASRRRCHAGCSAAACAQNPSTEEWAPRGSAPRPA
eukprot:203282-Pyramimonas_sp.AAC.1